MTVYTNLRIVTIDAASTVYKSGYIRIREGVIDEVGPMHAYSLLTGETEMDCTGLICMPGLVNAHTHLGLIPLRSLADDMPDRLRKYLFPMEQKFMTEAVVRNASHYGALESLLCGTTTLADMYYYSDAVAEELAKTGIRAFVGQTIIKESQTDYETESEAFYQAENLIRKWKSHARIQPMLAPHGTTTVSQEMIQRIHELSIKTDTKVMMHVSEMDYEMEQFSPSTPIQYLQSINVLDSNFIAVHAIHTNARDLDVLKDTGASVVHCPGANMKAGKGIADIACMIEKGISVGLGTDGPVSGNTLDMMSVIKLTALAQKTRYRQRDLFSSKDVLRLSTLGGAKVLGIDDRIGSIEKGKCADLLFVSTAEVNMYPIHDIEATLVYQLQAQNIHTVMVDGVVVVDNHKLVYDDIKRVRQSLESCIRSIQAAQ